MAEKYKFPEYTNSELKEMEKELQNYKITKTLSNGEEVTFYDEQKFFINKRVLSKNGAIMMVGSEKYPVPYALLKDKLDKLYGLERKRQYARKKELEERQKLST